MRPESRTYDAIAYQNAPLRGRWHLAGRGGFEPPMRYKRMPDFESGTFNHSATSPVCSEQGMIRVSGRSDKRG